jgi:hypothetical protein
LGGWQGGRFCHGKKNLRGKCRKNRVVLIVGSESGHLLMPPCVSPDISAASLAKPAVSKTYQPKSIFGNVLFLVKQILSNKQHPTRKEVFRRKIKIFPEKDLCG